MELITIERNDLPLLRQFSDRWIKKDYVVLSDAMYEWQFLEPTGGEQDFLPCLHAVSHNGQFVAIALARHHRIWVDQGTRTGVWLHEWFADTAAAGAGMALLRTLTTGGFHGAAGQSLAAQSVFSRLARVCRFELSRIFAVLDPARTREMLVRDCNDTPGYLSFRSVPPVATGVTLEEFPFDSAWDECWTAFRQSVSVATDRDSTFMRWRYARHPLFRYHWRTANTPAGRAWFVWREEEVDGHPKGVARLCEAVGSPEALRLGFPALFAFLTTRPLAFVDFFCSHADTIAGLLAGGMLHVVPHVGFDLPRLFSPLSDDPRKRILICFSLSSQDPSELLYGHHRAYFTKGDVNQDRPNVVDRKRRLL